MEVLLILEVIVLVGRAEGDRRQDIVQYAATKGFAEVRSGFQVDGKTGEVSTPLALLTGVSGYTADALARIGLTSVDDFSRLTVLEAWRRANQAKHGYALGEVAAYMAANDIEFADGPATALAQGYHRSRAHSLSILPELPNLDDRIINALGSHGVFSLELLEQLTDEDLLSISNISRTRVGQIREALRHYEDRQPK